MAKIKLQIADVVEHEFETALDAMRTLAEIVNLDGVRKVAVLHGADLEDIRTFVDAFTEGEDPEDNPLAGNIVRICETQLR